MKRPQINHQNMHLAVIKLLNDNQAIVASEPLVAKPPIYLNP